MPIEATLDKLITKAEKLDGSSRNLGGELMRLGVANDECRKNIRELLLDLQSGEDLICPNGGRQSQVGTVSEDLIFVKCDCSTCQYKSRIQARIKIVSQRTGIKV